MQLSPTINPPYTCFLAMAFLIMSFSFAVQSEKTEKIPKSDTSTVRKTSATDTVKSKNDSLSSAVSDSAKKGKKQDLKDTVHYEADNIAYDAGGRILQLTGHAIVRYVNMKLLADTIIYTMADNMFTATGKPCLIEDKDTTIGDFMVYNIKTKRGRVRTATTHIQDAYFTGQRIIKTQDDELYVAQGEYTTCAYPDTPHYYFYGERIRLKPNDKIISKPVVLNIGDAPVLALPYFIFPVDHDRKSGILTPVWGGNPAGGGYVDNLGYYWTPNDYFDLTTSARVQEFSEYMAEVSSKYNVKYLLNGGFSGQYVFNSNFLNSQRQWSLNYSHSQNLTPDGLTTLSGQGDLNSSQSFNSLYTQDPNELIKQDLTSNMTFSKQFPDAKAGLSVYWKRDQDLKDGHVTSDMPQINFNLSDRPLIPLPTQDVTMASTPDDTIPSHWYNTIYWGYTGQAIVHDDSYTDSAKQGFIQPGMLNSIRLSAPQKIFKYITINPNASANMATMRGYIDTAVIRYDTTHDTVTYTTYKLSDTSLYPTDSLISKTFTIRDSLGLPDTLYTIKKRNPVPSISAVHDTNNTKITNTADWQTGVSLSTNLYGIFPVHVLNFVGMRHTLSPSISYDFVPKHDLDKSFFPIGILPSGAHQQQQNVSFSLGNLFEGKLADLSAPSAAAASSTAPATPSPAPEGKPKETKFTILQANVSSAYNFEATERKWSNLSLTASTGSTYGLSFNSSFWMYDNNGKQVFPILNSYSITPTMPHFSAHGKLWDGDRILLDSLRKPDALKDFNAGPQTWNISIEPTFSFSASRDKPGDVMIPSKQFNLSASADCGFTRNWKFSWTAHYDPVTGQLVENRLNLQCDLECWNMQLQWRPEKLYPGYYFIINVKKIPEIKWEQREGSL